MGLSKSWACRLHARAVDLLRAGDGRRPRLAQQPADGAAEDGTCASAPPPGTVAPPASDDPPGSGRPNVRGRPRRAGRCAGRPHPPPTQPPRAHAVPAHRAPRRPPARPVRAAARADARRRERGWTRCWRRPRTARRSRPGELLALQASVFRYSQTVEVVSRAPTGWSAPSSRPWAPRCDGGRPDLATCVMTPRMTRGSGRCASRRWR